MFNNFIKTIKRAVNSKKQKDSETLELLTKILDIFFQKFSIVEPQNILTCVGNVKTPVIVATKEDKKLLDEIWKMVYNE